MAIDPVCHMDVEPESAAGVSQYQDATYYFCSPGCKRSPVRNPDALRSCSLTVTFDYPRGERWGIYSRSVGAKRFSIYVLRPRREAVPELGPEPSGKGPELGRERSK